MYWYSSLSFMSMQALITGESFVQCIYHLSSYPLPSLVTCTLQTVSNLNNSPVLHIIIFQSLYLTGVSPRIECGSEAMHSHSWSCVHSRSLSFTLDYNIWVIYTCCRCGLCIHSTSASLCSLYPCI